MLIQNDFRVGSAQPGPSSVSTLVAQCQPSAVRFYAANAIIYDQGAPAGPLYLIEFGAVRICRLTSDGRRQISAFHFAGDVFGFEANSEHGFFAESVDGAGVRVLRPSGTDRNADSLLPLAMRSLTRTQEHLLVLGRQSACERMAAFLLDLAERQETDSFVILPMQRRDIADYLGLTFETISRILRKLKEAGIIRLTDTNRIELLDLDALEDLRD
jgi:CRP/FNR family transcriptional regulator, nitrogen fixation regulation protein